jgi:hypothetical protein
LLLATFNCPASTSPQSTALDITKGMIYLVIIKKFDGNSLQFGTGIVFEFSTLILNVPLFDGAGKLIGIAALIIAIFVEHGSVLFLHRIIYICHIASKQRPPCETPGEFEFIFSQVVVIEYEFLRI